MIHSSDPPLFLKGEVNFNYLPWWGESEKLKRGWEYGTEAGLLKKRGGGSGTFPI